MVLNKKCMKCGKPATHKFVRIEGGQIFDLFFCQEHAAERSVYQKPKIPLADILANFLSQEQAAQAAQEGAPGLKCRACGLPFASYRKTLFLGCPDCYESFFEQLQPELRKFHGAAKHIGAKPGGGKESSEMPPTPLTPAIKPGGALVPIDEAEELKKQILPPAAQKLGKVETESEHEGEIEDIRAQLAGEIAELTLRLKRVIQQEDFAQAASIRDQIEALKTRLKNL